MREVLKAEEMKALACASKDTFAKFSDNFLALLEKRTGITKKDIPFCEFSLFPAYPPRFVGLDMTIVGGCGQDDGICSFAAVKALEAIKETPLYTSIVVFHAYEETGSNGATAAQSSFLVFALKDLLYKQNIEEMKHSGALSNSIAIAADVSALMDVNFASCHDRMNASILNCGTALSRYTGSAGKSGSSEAGVEFLDLIR